MDNLIRWKGMVKNSHFAHDVCEISKLIVGQLDKLYHSLSQSITVTNSSHIHTKYIVNDELTLCAKLSVPPGQFIPLPAFNSFGCAEHCNSVFIKNFKR